MEALNAGNQADGMSEKPGGDNRLPNGRKRKPRVECLPRQVEKVGALLSFQQYSDVRRFCLQCVKRR